MLRRIRQSPYTAYIALFFGIICIGFSAIFVKIANVPGSVSSFYRLFIAAILIIPLWIYRGMKIPSSGDIWLIFGGALFFAFDLFLWNTAILLTSAATATLLANNAPIWLGLITLVVLRQKLPRKFWVGLLVAIVGLNILVGIEAWRTMNFNRGDLLSLAAGFFYATYLLFTLDSRKRVDTVTFMTFSVVFMVILLFFTNLFLGNPFFGFSAKTWLALVGLGLIAHFLGWISINFALGHLAGTNVSVTLLSQTIITAILAIIILGETISLNQIAGGALILTGVYVVNRKNSKG
ncbi:MAG TPA: DMT family transporter [Tenuifilaceae bacterium]|nr:DMT family transporter [Tenuifilaceae bacterium]